MALTIRAWALSSAPDLSSEGETMHVLLGESDAIAQPMAMMKPHIPATVDDLQARYDLTLSHPAVDQAQFAAFEGWLAGAASRYGLSCGMIHEGVVREASARLATGRLTIGYHLDYFALWHLPDDPYARLAQAVEDAGGRSVNLPARARAFTDKAAAHAALQRRGLGVPATVIFRPWSSGRALTEGERCQLGIDVPEAHVFVKPANGFSSHGVQCANAAVVDAVVADRRRSDSQDTWLVQAAIRQPLLRCDDGIDRKAYWRVLYCLGELIPFWWAPAEPTRGQPSYRRLSAGEIQRYRLQAILKYTEELAELSGLDWFSTELCLSEGEVPSRYTVQGDDGWARPVVAIDYFNDQCDVDVQSRWLGAPPDAVVRQLALRFVDKARYLCGGRPPLRLVA
jgi:hypothetical protein